MAVLAVFLFLVWLGIVCLIARSRFAAAGAGCCTGIVTLGLIATSGDREWPIAFVVQSTLIVVLCLICRWTLRNRPVVVGIAVSLMLVGCLACLPEARVLLDYFALLQFRRQYPLESVSNRLAYESHRAAKPRELSLDNPLSIRLDERSRKYEVNDLNVFRETVLAQLYQQTLYQFLIGQGFGEDRMPNVRYGVEEILADVAPSRVPLPAMIPEPAATRRAPGSEPPLLSREDFLMLHANGLVDLFNRNRTGYVIDRDHVAGFKPHRMTRVPGFERDRLSRTSLTMVRLELVSLYRHGGPVAYVSDQLPQLDQLEHSRTRPLDDFERTELPRLYSETDLVVDELENRIRMIGAIRAREQCLRCHAAEIGELLGALSYEIAPIATDETPGG